jgi:hypothetical protein
MNQGFAAYACHLGEGSETVAGRIYIDRWTLRFQSASAKAEIPIGQLEVEWDPDGGRVCFGDPAQLDLKIYVPDESVLEHPVLVQSTRIRHQLQVRAGRGEIARRLRVTLYCFAACVLVACLVSLGTGAMVRSLAASVPAEWEKRFGNEQIQELRTRLVFVDDSNQVAHLTTLAAPLIKAAQLQGLTR